MDYHEQNVARNINIKGASGESSNSNKEHIIGLWGKYYPCYKAAEHLADCTLPLGGK